MGPPELLLRDLTLHDQIDSNVNESNGHDEEQNEKVDVDKVFAEEFSGWKGYIEWEDYPEKRAEAAAMLAKVASTFPPPPEFQLGPLPNTNPVLEGVRWKMWHKALGGPLKYVPEESWLRVIQEKHRDMLHLLQFPYNGEPPKVCLLKDTEFRPPWGLHPAKI
jgi:sulfite oxidase